MTKNFFILILSVAMLVSFGADANAVGLSADYVTYLGGTEYDQARDVAIDDAGNVYVTGGTVSRADFPATTRIIKPGTKEASTVNEFDIFVTKYDPSGNIVWSTLIGGPNYDRAYAVEVDAQGYVYVGGRAGRDFPVTAGVFQPTFSGGFGAGFYGHQDGVIFKLTPDGSNLLWASYFGADETGIVRDIALDSNGDIYLASGVKVSTATYPSAVRSAFSRGYWSTPRGGQDGVVAKVSGDGAQILWASYVGGSGDEETSTSVRVHSSGVYFLTATQSTNAPTSANAYDRTHNGDWDAYLVKMSLDGSQLHFATFYGGTGQDYCANTHNLALDANGNAVLSAITKSSDAPISANAAQKNYNGGNTGTWSQDGDVLLAKISADGSTLMAATYLGGSSNEGPEGLSIDGSGSIYVTGGTRSPDFPVTSDAYQQSYRGTNGNADGQLTKLSSDLSTIEYATYLGVPGVGTLRANDVNDNGVVAVAGPMAVGLNTFNAYQAQFKGNGDIAVARFSPASTSTPTPTPVPTGGKQGDINGDGMVTIQDLGILLSYWNAAHAPADLNGSGIIDIIDLGILLSNWG